MGRESGATIMLAIRLDMFCFPPAGPAPCPPFMLPPPPPPLVFAGCFGLSLLAPLTLPDDDRRPDLEGVSLRSLPVRLLVDAAELPPRRPSPPPPPANGPLLSLLLERGPREELSPAPLACLSLAGVVTPVVVVECRSLAVPRGRGGARPAPTLPLPLREEPRGLAGVVPEVLLEDRRDLAGVVTSWLGFPMSPSDPELE